jgi:tetratricopeptide (TPR) repeat protein
MFQCRPRQNYLLLCGLIVLESFSPCFAEDTRLPSDPPADSQEVSVSSPDDSGLPPGAIQYNKGVELFQIAQIQNEKGNAAGQKKLLKEAIKQFELSLQVNPKLVEAQSNIGFAYLTLHDYRQSIRAFEKALTINPNHLNTLNGLSTAYAFDKKTDEAIKTFNKLTTLDPANSQYFFNKGSVLQKAGRLEEAEQTYLQALKIKPNDQRVLFNLGTLYENQGKLQEAKPYYEKAKGVEIGNSIGLEAIRRLESINAALQQP